MGAGGLPSYLLTSVRCAPLMLFKSSTKADVFPPVRLSFSWVLQTISGIRPEA